MSVLWLCLAGMLEEVGSVGDDYDESLVQEDIASLLHC